MPFACVRCGVAACQTSHSLPVQMGREIVSLVHNVVAKQVVMAMQSDCFFNCVSLFFANDMR